MQDFINGDEQHIDANGKFTRQQLRRNERRKLFHPHWDSYLEFSKFQMLNTYRPSLFWNRLFFESPTFLHNIRFCHSLNLFELLICKYNYSFGLR